LFVDVDAIELDRVRRDVEVNATGSPARLLDDLPTPRDVVVAGTWVGADAARNDDHEGPPMSLTQIGRNSWPELILWSVAG
jgi:hypothetical protein